MCVPIRDHGQTSPSQQTKYPHEVPQFVCQRSPTRREHFIYSATHNIVHSPHQQPNWKNIDGLYGGLEGLRALHINFRFIPPEFHDKQKAWVERITWSLRLLRARRNFSLTFAVEGKDVAFQWPIVTKHQLPLELQAHILGHLEMGPALDRAQTFLACCLVCRAWFQICHRMLPKVTWLRTPRQLESLVATLSSSTHPIGAYIIELRLDDPLYRVAPLYLAPKLPSLRRLVINGDNQPISPGLWWRTTQRRVSHYLGHPSLSMYLKHFRSVTDLTISFVMFQSFWDFRRFVVALPVLASLHLEEVHMPGSDPFQRPDGRVPSLFSAPRNLNQLSTVSYGSDLEWNPLWIWVTPLQARHRKLESLESHPFLTSHDAEVIRELLECRENLRNRNSFYNMLPRQGDAMRNVTLDWFHNEEQQCKPVASLYCGNLRNRHCSGSLRILCGGYPRALQGPGTHRSIEFTTYSSENPENTLSFQPRPGKSFLASAILEVESFAGADDPAWGAMDTLYDSLENLQSLQVNASSLYQLFRPYGASTGGPDVVEEIRRHLPLLRARNNFKLTFTIEGQPILWETLGYQHTPEFAVEEMEGCDCPMCNGATPDII